MDEEKFLKLINPMLLDESHLELTFTYGQLWYLINSLQMAAAHPTVDEEEKETLQRQVRIFQSIITQRYPELHDFIEAGWRPRVNPTE